MIVPQDLSGDDSRERVSYGPPQVSLLSAPPAGWSNDKLALEVERSPLEGPTLPMTNRDGVGFHRDCLPPPRAYRQVRAPAVWPARSREPELTGAFPANTDAADPISAFAQVTGPRPKA